MMDYDGDADVDDEDVAAFFDDFEAPMLDCDGNGTNDLIQILQAPELDANQTGILDVCEAGGDLNGDGTVGVEDLLAVILKWGACPGGPIGCVSDTNGDGVIDVTDLVTVIANWG
jgi:hypothetical protein